MRIHCLLLLLSLLSQTELFGQSVDRHNPSEWKEHVVKAGRFAVLLPYNDDSPEYFEAYLTMPSGNSAAKIPAHRFGGSEGDVMYMADYCDLPADLSKRILADIKTDLEKDPTATYKSISIDSHPGLEFEAHGPRGLEIGRVYLVGQRLYSLFVSRPENTTAPNNTGRFLASFRLLSR